MILLDTHVFIWWLDDDRRCPEPWREAIESHRVYVSAIAIWEMAIKAAIGKLKLRGRAKDLEHLIGNEAFDELPFDSRHAAQVRSLPPHHADPFDRAMIAQAQIERLTLVSADPAFAAYDVRLLPK